MATVGAIFQVLVILLPEIIALAKSFKDSPQEAREKALKAVREAMAASRAKLGDTKKIEDIVNG